MNALKMAGIALIAAGILGLVYGSFSFTKETHEAKIGPIELSVKDKQTVNVPVWAGVGAIVIGGALLVFGGRRGGAAASRQRSAQSGNRIAIPWRSHAECHRTDRDGWLRVAVLWTSDGTFSTPVWWSGLRQRALARSISC